MNITPHKKAQAVLLSAVFAASFTAFAGEHAVEQKEEVKKETSSVAALTSDEMARTFIKYCPNTLIIDFSAEWCGPCKAMKPIFESFAKEQESTYTCVTIDIEQCPEVAKEYGIMSIPTIGVFVQGKLVDKIVGQQKSTKALLEKIEQILAAPQDLSKLDKDALNIKLINALQVGTVDDIKRLLEAGADVNASQDGLTPLMYATFVLLPQGRDMSDVIKVLLEHGASTEFDTPQGKMQAVDCMQPMVDQFKRMQANLEKAIVVLKNDAQTKKDKAVKEDKQQ